MFLYHHWFYNITKWKWSFVQSTSFHRIVLKCKWIYSNGYMYRHIQLDQLFKMLVHHTRAKTNDKRTPPPPSQQLQKQWKRKTELISALTLSYYHKMFEWHIKMERKTRRNLNFDQIVWVALLIWIVFMEVYIHFSGWNGRMARNVLSHCEI